MVGLSKLPRFGMLSRHPDLQCSLSDHFSVEATLVHSRAMEADSEEDEEVALRNGTYLSLPTSSESKTMV